MMIMSRPYFRSTTPQQRRYLFEIWEETNNVSQACQRARVSRGTFYHWKERFDTEGYDGLLEVERTGPRQPKRVAAEIEEVVIRLKQENPHWGKQQISRQVPEHLPGQSINPNTVRRILVDAGLWAV